MCIDWYCIDLDIMLSLEIAKANLHVDILTIKHAPMLESEVSHLDSVEEI